MQGICENYSQKSFTRFSKRKTKNEIRSKRVFSELVHFLYFHRVKKDLEKRKQKQQKNAENKQKSASKDKDKDKDKETPNAKASILEDTTKTGQEGSPSYIPPREEGDRIRKIYLVY